MGGYDATELYARGKKRRGKGHTADGVAPTTRLDRPARVSQHGSPAEKASVRSTVHSKFPDIGAD